MPYGWECRSRLLKQVPLKPTEKRPTKWDGFVLPGPNHYEQKELFCGDGFSHIKRAPKYTFGLKPPLLLKSITKNAQLYNIRGLHKKGVEHIPQGTIAEKCELPGSKLAVPGPGTYAPKDLAQMKRPPAYSMRIAAKPPYQPWDMWTPSPNMYCPPIMKGSKAPAYTFTDKMKVSFDNKMPGPGEYTPNTVFTEKANPAFSLGGPTRERKLPKSPAPNAYCEKAFLAVKSRAPAPSFGIKHTKYLGKDEYLLQPQDLEDLKKK